MCFRWRGWAYLKRQFRGLLFDREPKLRLSCMRRCFERLSQALMSSACAAAVSVIYGRRRSYTTKVVLRAWEAAAAGTCRLLLTIEEVKRRYELRLLRSAKCAWTGAGRLSAAAAASHLDTRVRRLLHRTVWGWGTCTGQTRRLGRRIAQWQRRWEQEMQRAAFLGLRRLKTTRAEAKRKSAAVARQALVAVWRQWYYWVGTARPARKHTRAALMADTRLAAAGLIGWLAHRQWLADNVAQLMQSTRCRLLRGAWRGWELRSQQARYSTVGDVRSRALRAQLLRRRLRVVFSEWSTWSQPACPSTDCVTRCASRRAAVTALRAWGASAAGLSRLLVPFGEVGQHFGLRVMARSLLGWATRLRDLSLMEVQVDSNACLRLLRGMCFRWRGWASHEDALLHRGRYISTFYCKIWLSLLSKFFSVFYVNWQVGVRFCSKFSSMFFIRKNKGKFFLFWKQWIQEPGLPLFGDMERLLSKRGKLSQIILVWARFCRDQSFFIDGLKSAVRKHKLSNVFNFWRYFCLKKSMFKRNFVAVQQHRRLRILQQNFKVFISFIDHRAQKSAPRLLSLSSSALRGWALVASGTSRMRPTDDAIMRNHAARRVAAALDLWVTTRSSLWTAGARLENLVYRNRLRQEAMALGAFIHAARKQHDDMENQPSSSWDNVKSSKIAVENGKLNDYEGATILV